MPGVGGLGGGVVFTVGNQVACCWTKEPNTPETQWNVSGVNGGNVVVLQKKSKKRQNETNNEASFKTA